MPVTTIQSLAISGHLVETPFNLARHGPENAVQFMLLAPATVRYQLITGGPVYADTLPALTPALVYGKTDGSNTVDVSLARYVIFTVPVRGGPAILYIAPEGYWNYIVQQGFVIPLYYAWLHAWQVYQGTGGVATPPPGGSMTGGGVVGGYASQSFQGGGVSASSLLLVLDGIEDNASNDPNKSELSSQWGTWFKVDALPSGPTTLLDLTADDASGYIRYLLYPDGSVHMLTSLYGLSGDTTIVPSATPVAPRRWYWLGGASQRWAYNNNHQWNGGGIWAEGGVLLNQGFYDTGQPYALRFMTAPLRIGVGGAGATAANAPNRSGWQFARPCVLLHSNSWANIYNLAPTTGNYGGVGGVGYNSQEPAGAAPSIADTSGQTARALRAGPQGMAVVTDGPFADASCPLYDSGSTPIGFFLKVGAAPAAETLLVDATAGALGWVRASLTPAGTLHVAYQYYGAAAVDLIARTPDNTANVVLPTNSWLWISVGAYHVVVYQGATPLADTTASGAGSLSGRVVLGWGAPTRPYEMLAGFPNDAGHKMSKLYIANRGGAMTPLAADPAAGNIVYACRDGLGAQTLLLDSSGNALPLVAAAQGITVAVEGPYA